MIQSRIIEEVGKIGEIHGIKFPDFLKICKDKSINKMTQKERDAMIELSRASILTTPDLLEYYLGIKAYKIRFLMANEHKQAKYDDDGLTIRERKVVNFISDTETSIRELVDKFGSEMKSKRNVKELAGLMARKGILERVRRGIYITKNKAA